MEKSTLPTRKIGGVGFFVIVVSILETTDVFLFDWTCQISM